MARVRRYAPPEREPVIRICGGRRRAAASEALPLILPLSGMPVAISASPALPVQAIMIQRPRPSMLQELLAKHPPIFKFIKLACTGARKNRRFFAVYLLSGPEGPEPALGRL